MINPTWAEHHEWAADKLVDALKAEKKPCPHTHQHTTTTYANEMAGWETICDDCGELIDED